MLQIGTDEIEEIFQGELGVCRVALGDETIETRKGGYCYIQLETKKENV